MPGVTAARGSKDVPALLGWVSCYLAAVGAGVVATTMETQRVEWEITTGGPVEDFQSFRWLQRRSPAWRNPEGLVAERVGSDQPGRIVDRIVSCD